MNEPNVEGIIYQPTYRVNSINPNNTRIFVFIAVDVYKRQLQKYSQPYIELMSCYRCALMEVETKFNVLDEELSLQYDRNPIETVDVYKRQVVLMTDMAALLVAIVTLGYLGIGITAPTPDCGSMISEGQTLIGTAPYLSLLPGLMVVYTGISLSLIGDGLADRWR